MAATAQRLLHINLLLLGLRPEEVAAKHKVDIKPSMFDSRNRKGLEYVLKFLLEKIDAERARTSFKFCWPVMDKKQESSFRKVTTEWILEIAEEHPEVGLSITPAAVLLNPSGHKVHALLLRLSAFLLQRETDHLSGVDTADLTPRFHPATALEGPCCELRSHALKSHIARLSARFVEHAQGAVRVQQSWRVYSVQLAQGWRQTAKTRRVVEGRVAELKAAGHGRITHKEQDARIARLRAAWSELDDFCTKSRADMTALDNVMGGRANRVHLDAASVKLTPPLAAVQVAEQLPDVQDCYTSGRLSLTGFFQLWAIALDNLTKEIRKCASQSHAKCDEVATLIHRHKKYLAQTRELHSQLTGGIATDLVASTENLTASVKQLQAQAGLNPRWRSREDTTQTPPQPTSKNEDQQIGHVAEPLLVRLGLVPPPFSSASGPSAAQHTPHDSDDGPVQLKLENSDLLAPSISSIYDDILAKVVADSSDASSNGLPNVNKMQTLQSKPRVSDTENSTHNNQRNSPRTADEQVSVPDPTTEVSFSSPPRPSATSFQSPKVFRGTAQFTPSPQTAPTNRSVSGEFLTSRKALANHTPAEVEPTGDTIVEIDNDSDNEEQRPVVRSGIVASTRVLPNGFASPPRQRVPVTTAVSVSPEVAKLAKQINRVVARHGKTTNNNFAKAQGGEGTCEIAATQRAGSDVQDSADTGAESFDPTLDLLRDDSGLFAFLKDNG